jgi:hypothetical protein
MEFSGGFYSGGSLKYLFVTVDELLFLAARHDGYAHGEYVRDVVVNVLNHDFSEVFVKTVRIIFNTVESLNKFVSEATDNYGKMFSTVDGRTFLRDSFGDICCQLVLTSKEFPLKLYFRCDTLQYDPSSRAISFVGHTQYNLTNVLSEVKKSRCFLVNTNDGVEKSAEGDDVKVITDYDFRSLVENGWSIFVHTPEGEEKELMILGHSVDSFIIKL